MALNNANRRQKNNDCFLIYPPNLSTIYPPVSSPKVGLVRHTI